MSERVVYVSVCDGACLSPPKPPTPAPQKASMQRDRRGLVYKCRYEHIKEEGGRNEVEIISSPTPSLTHTTTTTSIYVYSPLFSFTHTGYSTKTLFCLISPLHFTHHIRAYVYTHIQYEQAHTQARLTPAVRLVSLTILQLSLPPLPT